jgi:acetylornithine deacetylase/succinyl-diaminopimelate desuccinylase-like protein
MSAMSSSPSQLRDQLADGHEAASANTLMLSNTLMLGEIPSPSGQEAARVRFLADRFRQSGLQAISIDEEGNVQAIIPGKKGLRNILVTARADTHLSIDPNQRITINVGAEHLLGPGMADNTLGLSALVSLPELLVRLGVELDANLILLGHVKSLGSCDQRGLRFFLENFPRPLDAGLVVEGISLGRLNHFCNGMVQAEITCRVHQDSTKRWEASENAIIIMHRVIRRILEIPIPQEPRTSVIMGSIRAGKTFNRPPGSARLRLEIRSEEPGRARDIRHEISRIIDEISAETASECAIKFPALRKPGGIPFSHPFVTAARDILDDLNVQPVVGPSYSDLSTLASNNIPTLTVGLSRATNLNEPAERVEIEPILSGLAQVISLLERMDHELESEIPE